MASAMESRKGAGFGSDAFLADLTVAAGYGYCGMWGGAAGGRRFLRELRLMRRWGVLAGVRFED
jgi:hypothetical protein